MAFNWQIIEALPQKEMTNFCGNADIQHCHNSVDIKSYNFLRQNVLNCSPKLIDLRNSNGQLH